MVVGDVVMLKAGDKAPADCLFIDAINATVDESHYIQEEGADKVVKERGDLLFADSYLLSGSAKVVVCAVGENSTREEPEFDTRDQATPLSVKLDRIGNSIRFFGVVSAIGIVVLALVITLL